MRPDTQNWIALSDYDLETARHMLATGRFLYVIFMCHLALEKMLKAHFTEVTQSIPPKTHDLIYLIRKSGLELPQAHLEFIGKINNASVPTLPRRFAADHRAIPRIGRTRLSGKNRGGAQVVERTSELKITIQRFRAELEKMGIRCERILLFGSQANGTAQEGSDIDLFVVSSDWARYNDRERFEILGIAAARILEPIQARGITPDEIATHRLSSFWEQVLQEQTIAIA
jgi:predicted nucleotidyltransferase/HEPN domain-containing protein